MRRLAEHCALGALLTLPALAQATATAAAMPIVRVAFAAAPSRTRLPALAELCERQLPALAPELRGQALQDAFAIEWRADGVHRLPAAATVPEGTAALGSCRFGDAPPLLWSTAVDGVEDWFVPADFPLPPTWNALLAAGDVQAFDTPFTLSVSTLVGHLAGALLHGDPITELLQTTAAACGDATWLAFRDADGNVRVRARADGGLALPVALALLAAQNGPAPAPRTLRAFANRDVHRSEAARQLLRSAGPMRQHVLRALLHADDDTAFTAIDSLVHDGDADALPLIVAAAAPDRPACTLAASAAVAALWVDADARVRQRTRGALARCACPELRSLDLAALDGRGPTPLPPEPTLDGRSRLLLWLAFGGIALLVAWLRERHRPETLVI